MISSNTMSAELSPVCGRAGPTLSILTASAGRCGISLGSEIGTPVSGMRGMSGSVVVVTSIVVGGAVVAGASVVVLVVVELVVGASVVVLLVTAAAVVDEAASSSPPEQAASTSSSAATMAAAMAVRVRITIPSTVRCALRAAVAYRTSDEVHQGDRCHPPRS